MADNNIKEGEVLPKHPGGRPAIYTSIDDMQESVDTYFIDIARNRAAIRLQEPLPDNTSTDNWHPTVTGLATAIGMDREGIKTYGKRDEFSYTIKRARNRVQEYLEQRLYDSSPAGAIFNLKNNYGWRDEKHLSVDTQETKTIQIVSLPGTGITEQLESVDIPLLDDDTSA